MVFSTLNLLNATSNAITWTFGASMPVFGHRISDTVHSARTTGDVVWRRWGKGTCWCWKRCCRNCSSSCLFLTGTPNGTHGTMAFHHWYPWYPKNGWQIPWITSNHKTHCQYCPNSHSVTTYIYLPYITCQIERFRNGLGFVRPRKSKSSLILLAILLGPVRICQVPFDSVQGCTLHWTMLLYHAIPTWQHQRGWSQSTWHICQILVYDMCMMCMMCMGVERVPHIWWLMSFCKGAILGCPPIFRPHVGSPSRSLLPEVLPRKARNLPQGISQGGPRKLMGLQTHTSPLE